MKATEIKKKLTELGAWEEFQKAFKNDATQKKHGLKISGYLKECMEGQKNFMDVMLGAFVWKDTANGFRFWDKISES